MGTSYPFGMMASAPLSRHMPHACPAALTLTGDIALSLARVHEICGAARRTLALQIAARAGAPVIWIAPDWGSDRLGAQAMAPVLAPQLHPGQLLFVATARQSDMLWAMEEALKDGAVPVVVAEMDAPPGMTPIRRLHLAAQAGAATGPSRPLGLILTPGDGGAPGIETRWRCDPCHRPDRTGWRLDRLRARMLPPQSWHWDGRCVQPWPKGEGSAAPQGAPLDAAPSPTLGQPRAGYVTSIPATIPATTPRSGNG